MKIISKIIAIICAVTITATSMLCFASTVSPYRNGEVVLEHNSKFSSYGVQNGIDVSENNGVINWQAVAASGTVQFAFIRIGRTGYMSDFTMGADAQFEANYNGAVGAGIPVGVYWYSQAVNTAEASAEAQTLLSYLKGRGLSLPIVYDCEFAYNAYGAPTGRVYEAFKSKKLTKSKMTSVASAFCKVIASSGYTPCIYASKSFLTDNTDYAKLQKSYKIWMANYTTKSDYSGYYEYWQYSQKGTVPGINGPVDCNVRYCYNQVSKVKALYKAPKTTSVSQLKKGKKKFTAKWKSVAGVSAYQIQYSTSKKFTKKATKTVTVKGSKSKSKTIAKLKAKKKYYVRIRSYKTVYGTKVYSKYSKTKTITTLK